MATKQELITKWIQFLKNNRIVDAKSDPNGQLKYRRAVTADDVSNFLRTKAGYTPNSIKVAIDSVLTPGGADSSKNMSAADDGEDVPDDEQTGTPQQGQTQGQGQTPAQIRMAKQKAAQQALDKSRPQDTQAWADKQFDASAGKPTFAQKRAAAATNARKGMIPVPPKPGAPQQDPQQDQEQLPQRPQPAAASPWRTRNNGRLQSEPQQDQEPLPQRPQPAPASPWRTRDNGRLQSQPELDAATPPKPNMMRTRANGRLQADPDLDRMQKLAGISPKGQQELAQRQKDDQTSQAATKKRDADIEAQLNKQPDDNKDSTKKMRTSVSKDEFEDWQSAQKKKHAAAGKEYAPYEYEHVPNDDTDMAKEWEAALAGRDTTQAQQSAPEPGRKQSAPRQGHRSSSFGGRRNRTLHEAIRDNNGVGVDEQQVEDIFDFMAQGGETNDPGARAVAAGRAGNDSPDDVQTADSDATALLDIIGTKLRPEHRLAIWQALKWDNNINEAATGKQNPDQVINDIIRLNSRPALSEHEVKLARLQQSWQKDGYSLDTNSLSRLLESHGYDSKDIRQVFEKVLGSNRDEFFVTEAQRKVSARAERNRADAQQRKGEEVDQNYEEAQQRVQAAVEKIIAYTRKNGLEQQVIHYIESEFPEDIKKPDEKQGFFKKMMNMFKKKPVTEDVREIFTAMLRKDRPHRAQLLQLLEQRDLGRTRKWH